MATLGREKLIERMQARELVVSPILSRDQIGASSIDLRMGNIVLMVRARGASHVDPAAVKAKQPGHGVEVDRAQKHEKFDIPFKSKFLLHPGSLALAPTLEWLRLPSDVMGIVTARSTWSSEGVKHRVRYTDRAELLGDCYDLNWPTFVGIPRTLYPGMKIAPTAFFSVVGKTERPEKPQFAFSVEPRQGNIVGSDDPSPTHADLTAGEGFLCRNPSCTRSPCPERLYCATKPLPPAKNSLTPTTYPPPEHNHFHPPFILPTPACPS